jgi:hypothetical protein
MIRLFVLLFTLLVVLASSTSGDQHFREIVIQGQFDFSEGRTVHFARKNHQLS